VLQMAHASTYDYATEIAGYVLAGQLVYRNATTDRQRALELLTTIRDKWAEQRIMLVELTFIDTLLGLERAKAGDLDSAISLIQNSVDLMFNRNLVTYYIPAMGFLVEALLGRGTGGDAAEADAVIARLAAAPAEGSVIRDVWLLRMRALLARARGDETGYRELRDRYREMATSLGFEGHMQWAAAMP
jgi:adenylate cyclase